MRIEGKKETEHFLLQKKKKHIGNLSKHTHTPQRKTHPHKFMKS